MTAGDSVAAVVVDPDLARELGTAGRKSREWIQRRDALIVRALAGGAGPREVARLAGLTHPTVIAIARREAKRSE